MHTSRQDRDIFFGREQETEALYEALSGVKHLLIYGPSGAGKTSLVECGLRNQFSDADWFALTMRRGSDAVASFYASINEVLDTLYHLTQPLNCLRITKKALVKPSKMFFRNDINLYIYSLTNLRNCYCSAMRKKSAIFLPASTS